MFRCEGAVLEADDISNGRFHADGLTQHWLAEKITICLNRKNAKTRDTSQTLRCRRELSEPRLQRTLGLDSPRLCKS